MIQINLTKSEKFSFEELAQMAIDTNVQWLQISPDAIDDNPIDTIGNLVELCRETDTILTLKDNVELVNRFKTSGIFLSDASKAATVREELGPHAIIGTIISSPEQTNQLAKADIDYALVSASKVGNQIDFFKEFISQRNNLGSELPIVAVSGLSASHIKQLLTAGISAVIIDFPGTDDSPELEQQLKVTVSALTAEE